MRGSAASTTSNRNNKTTPPLAWLTLAVGEALWIRASNFRADAKFKFLVGDNTDKKIEPQGLIVVGVRRHDKCPAYYGDGVTFEPGDDMVAPTTRKSSTCQPLPRSAGDADWVGNVQSSH